MGKVSASTLLPCEAAQDRPNPHDCHANLAGSHQCLGKCDGHPSTHKLKEDSHSAVVIKVLEFSDKVGKRPGGYSDCLSFLQMEVELDVAVPISSLALAGVGRARNSAA